MSDIYNIFRHVYLRDNAIQDGIREFHNALNHLNQLNIIII